MYMYIYIYKVHNVYTRMYMYMFIHVLYILLGQISTGPTPTSKIVAVLSLRSKCGNPPNNCKPSGAVLIIRL
jgi:hypothetical protein